MEECPTPEEMQQAVDGKDRYERVFEHISKCDRCGEFATSTGISADTGPPQVDMPRTEQVAGRPESSERNSESPQLGRRFADYEILDYIAQGAMGVVYKARQVSLDRLVALKVIRGGEFANIDQIRRFHVEASAAAKFEHPNIVRIYEVGEHGGRHFFSMGLIDGRTLKSKLEEGPLAPRAAAEMVLTVAQAMAYAHDRDVIHRDLKPSNILIDDSDGQPRVADFGLAKRLDTESHLTLTGDVIGTPAYMPPEQAAGRLHETGKQADVYSLGAVLYHLVVGRPPFHAANAIETIRQVIEEEPLAPRQLNPAVDRDLETIALKCLEKTLTKRYASAHDLAADLDRYLRQEPIRARRISRLERGWRWCRRNKLASALAMSILLGLVMTTFQWRRAESNLVLVGEANTDLQTEKERALHNYQMFRRQLDTTSVPIAFPSLVSHSPEGRRAEMLTSRTEASLLSNQQFVRENDDSPALRDDVAQSWLMIAGIYFTKARGEESSHAFQQAIGRLEELLSENPRDLTTLVRLAYAYDKRGFVLDKLNRPREAASSIAAGAGIADRIAADQDRTGDLPLEPARRILCAGHALHLANDAYNTDRPATAFQLADLGHRAVEGVDDNTLPDHTRRLMASICYVRGLSHDKLRRYDDAIADLQRAIELDPVRGPWQFSLNLAYAVVHTGEHERATGDADALAANSLAQEHPRAEVLVYGAAAINSRAIAELRKIASLTEAEKSQLEERYAMQSLEWLKKWLEIVAEGGVDIVQLLETDGDLDAIRSRPEFVELLRQLEAN
ncbi:MAG: protein kinase [Pirellulaceae bacterium]|nr:protein kinase [Pirellulaceae bacterium]